MCHQKDDRVKNGTSPTGWCIPASSPPLRDPFVPEILPGLDFAASCADVSLSVSPFSPHNLLTPPCVSNNNCSHTRAPGMSVHLSIPFKGKVPTHFCLFCVFLCKNMLSGCMPYYMCGKHGE
ncbi:hypothetical protein RLOC_00004978 [Lonchura striata]|uniref:Uncharacterized protein n=1 Tax=Lonchura striata TaxID=40157 RepID=A0A218UPC7_9PASE|nr:hypothetical protein RLOC_00004978 [Lonchura striata domestica]